MVQDRPKRSDDVGYGFYCCEIVFLSLAVLIPIAVWAIWRDGDLLARSGSLAVFFSVLTEFWLLNKANAKHLKNAIRVSRGEPPQEFSCPAVSITIASLAIALVGTVIWGFADVFIK